MPSLGTGMKINRAFWDSSALIPLFCSDSYSRQSRELLRRFPQVVVWWNTSTEIHGTFVRLFQQGHLTKEGLKKSLQYHDQLRLRWREVLPVPELRDLADQC